MRVRVTKPTRTYWNYTVIDVPAGEEHDGEFARHLYDTGVKVEVLEHDPEPEPAPALVPGGQKDEDPGASQDGDEPPLDGTIGALLEWVGTDLDRARTALAAEQGREKPRKAVVTKLTELTEPAAQ